MTSITWLVALLCPRAISPHPNFISTDARSAPGELGLMVQGRIQDWSRPHDGIEEEPFRDDEERFLTAARSAILGEGAGGVADLEGVIHDSRVDPGIAGAAALLGSVKLAESDLYSDAFRLLAGAGERLSASSHEQRLFKAALKQQEAVRRIEAGESFEAHRDEARALLVSVDIAQIDQFPISKGSRWDARTTIGKVRDLLLNANQDLFDLRMAFPDEKMLQDRLRREQSSILEAHVQSAGTGARAFIEEQFAEFTMSSEKVLGGRDGVEGPVRSSLRLFELAGHYRQARAHRSLLGLLLFLRAGDSDRAMGESLRLIRQSGDLKASKRALNYVRAQGPLHVLRSETWDVLDNRLSARLLRDVELSTIEAGAQTLDEPLAQSGLRSLLELVEVPGPPRVSGGELRSVRVGQVLSASMALANVCGAHGYVAERLLGLIRAVGDPDEELHARAYVRAAEVIDWKAVSDETRSDWRSWLSRESPSGPWRTVIQAVSPRLALPVDERTVDPADFSLSLLAHELNAIVEGASPVRGLADIASEPIVDAIENARHEAARGAFSFGGIDLGDVAVVSMLHLGLDLWNPIVDYITDPNIPRSFKEGALERIAASPAMVPEWVRNEISRRADGVLATQYEPMRFNGRPSGPFGAAIRLFGVLRIWDGEMLFAEVAKLGLGDNASRLEGARTVAALIRGMPEVPEWLISAAVSSSSDRVPNVRAESGRGLVYALGKVDFARALVIDRIGALIAEEGTLVPLLVLRALSANPLRVPSELEGDISRVARDHLIFAVRDQASHLYETLTSRLDAAADGSNEEL